MPLHDDLGTRMKTYYEQIPKIKLLRRTPVAIRIDGKAFHTFTRGFQKPFDGILVSAMQETMRYLCEHIQGCVLGYTQSDEITLILIDYQNLNSSAWFDYEVQKMCSIAASMATMAFNSAFQAGIIAEQAMSDERYRKTMAAAVKKGAMFDARVFNIPKEEVANLIYWRQLDAIRNSIQMVGQANFSPKQLHGKSCSQIQQMLLEEKGIDWASLPVYLQRGSCCVKEIVYTKNCQDSYRTHWIIDQKIPIFKGEDREYIDRLIRNEKSVKDYYMSLNGIAYDPFRKDGDLFIRVLNLRSKTEQAVFSVVNGRPIRVFSSMSDCAMAQVERDLPRNVNLILEGLPEEDSEAPK